VASLPRAFLEGNGNHGLDARPRSRHAWCVRHLLPVHGPLDLALTFGCGQAFRWRAGEGVWNGVVGRAEARLRERGPSSLQIDVVGEDPGRTAWIRYLRLDEDPLVHLEGAAELRNLPGFEPLLGLRLLRQEPWETLASFIGSAAANIRKITNCVEGLSDTLGDPIEGSAQRTFPAPAAIARAHESDLRAVGLGFRAPYLLETARRLDANPLAWDALRDGPIEEARAKLMGFPGVGAKIADCVLLFGLDRLDAYPVDRWIRRATLELAGRKRANDRELDAWALRLGPGRGYLQQILFHLRRTCGPFPRLALPKR
jgi:N-glycosylase/DNA lyase